MSSYKLDPAGFRDHSPLKGLRKVRGPNRKLYGVSFPSGRKPCVWKHGRCRKSGAPIKEYVFFKRGDKRYDLIVEAARKKQLSLL